MAGKRYVLTARAESDLREARAWSRARWGKPLTRRYFEDLHRAAEYIPQNHAALAARPELDGGTGLRVHPVREHFLVYEPLNPRTIVVVACLRQGRNIPTILQKWRGAIRRELSDIRLRIEGGEIRLPTTGTTTMKRRHK